MVVASFDGGEDGWDWSLAPCLRQTYLDSSGGLKRNCPKFICACWAWQGLSSDSFIVDRGLAVMCLP